MALPPPLPSSSPEPHPDHSAEEQLPDWLKDLSDAESVPPPIEADSVPPDLSQPQTEDKVVPEEEIVSAPQEEGNLTETEEAVPVSEPPTEMAKPDSESSGPFAGIEGVLPLPPPSPEIIKPAAYPIKLSVSDEQLAYIAVLEKINRAEKEPHPVAQPASNPRSSLFKLIFLVILIAALLLPLVFGVPEVLPPSVSVDVDSVWQRIEALPANSKVILAVDYDPASSAELEIAASPVIDHLLVRQAHLFLLSTTPMGPLLADRLVQLISASRQGVEAINSQVTNLGYLPGGPVGLASFARDPGQTLPGAFQAIRGVEIVAPEEVDHITSLKDIAMLLVLTESPDTARMWIEQVQPYLYRRPMLMVLSAQAEPVIRTYAEGTGAPVQGMIVGVAGGVAYERLTGMATPLLPVSGVSASQIWSAYVIGAWTLAILVVLSSTLHLIRVKVDSDRQTHKEETQ